MLPDSPLSCTYFVRVCDVAIHFAPAAGADRLSTADLGRSFYECWSLMYIDPKVAAEAVSCWASLLKEEWCVTWLPDFCQAKGHDMW